MKCSLFSFLFALFAFFISSQQAFAAIELRYSPPPTEIKHDEEFTLTVTLAGADPNLTYYIRGAFFKSGTTQYLGFTQNQTGYWNASGSDYTQFFAIKGSETTNISFKPDSTSPYFSPNTEYLFKLGRYTTSGNLTWSDQMPQTIFVTAILTPTPTLLFTPTQSLAPSQELSVVLSEVVACPSSGVAEWVELHNLTQNSVEINNWLLSDSTDSHAQSLSHSFEPDEYAIFELSSSIFNNSGDEVVLKDGQNKEIARFEYEDCESNTSYINHNSEWKKTQTITKKSPNLLTVPTPTPTHTIKPTSTPKIINTITEQKSPPRKDEDDEPTQSSISIVFEELTIPKEASLPALTFIQNSKVAPTISVTKSSKPVEPIELEREPDNSGAYAIILGGISYILSAAVLSQKWYTVLSG